MNTTSPILKIKNLRSGYLRYVDILNGIDLAVAPGEALGIIGLNGCGKSTLGKSIMNMVPYRRGDIEFNGRNVNRLTTAELSRQGIAIMQQGGAVFPDLSVYDNLRMAFGVHPDRAYLEQLAAILPLLRKSRRQMRNLMADKLSGGNRHELALAMTLAQKPSLVILDEPSAGLSPIAVESMYSALRQLRSSLGLTIILIEQNIAKALEFADRCVLLQNGVTAGSFQPNEIEKIETTMFNKKII